jgi:hypothetical protein
MARGRQATTKDEDEDEAGAGADERAPKLERLELWHEG